MTRNVSDGPIDERVLLARQPILDRDERVVAYELLYRPIPDGGGPLDPVAATAAVIVNGLSDVGLDSLVGPHPAYVNVTREFLLGVPALPLAPERVVLELLEDQELDGALLDALRTLVDAGFTIALDDFQYSPEQDPLLELAAIAKLDVRALSPERLAHDAALLKRRGLRLVAEKVETYEEAQHCKALGFDAFQGYYFARPALVHGRPLPTTQITTLCRLLETGADVDIDELETIIECDLGLSQRLLRLSNSAALSPATPVRSLRHALTMLGTRAIRRNATILSLAGIADAPHVVLGTALVRARMAEQLAPWSSACPDRAFTVGLFSLLGALVRQPLPELLSELPFDERTTAALLHGTEPEGELLRAIVAHERGEALPDGFPARRVARSYRAATSWSDSLSSALA
jgi:EAL and modified HD-GYP domain-containing signal transduction protein